MAAMKVVMMVSTTVETKDSRKVASMGVLMAAKKAVAKVFVKAE